MKLRHEVYYILMAAAFFLSGCATADKNVSAGLVASGETMLAVSTAYTNTAMTTYFPNCLPAARPGFEKFCPAFKAFSKKFDEVYQPAVKSWYAAVESNDTGAALGAEAAVLQLTTELAAITASVLIQGGK